MDVFVSTNVFCESVDEEDDGLGRGGGRDRVCASVELESFRSTQPFFFPWFSAITSSFGNILNDRTFSNRIRHLPTRNRPKCSSGASIRASDWGSERSGERGAFQLYWNSWTVIIP